MSASPDDWAGYPEILADLADQVRARLAARGLDSEQAAAIGREVAEYMRLHWGKSWIYIPQGQAYELGRRDREIYRRWRGSANCDALCREYDLTPQRLYQIVKAVGAAERKKRQPDMFGS